MPAGGYHEDRRDGFLRVAAAPTNQVIAVASSLDSDFRDRGWIVDHLDSYEVEFSFQSFPTSTSGLHGAR